MGNLYRRDCQFFLHCEKSGYFFEKQTRCDDRNALINKGYPNNGPFIAITLPTKYNPVDTGLEKWKTTHKIM